ncbi:Crp/Fnr family transcriptional regulator [Massilia endophytica]|uniref:Crp/Fnr family transcriptional regulator n=1 Tax=Massilia endophytica TaxID=2899220 RepID=UPI001E569BA9|nr:Crp/Fnr family transcriptional regulator [Massilia endophytica]UGQ46055.1 Crp/Fnr family transcriptional regulator [Massilia endophytica]
MGTETPAALLESVAASHLSLPDGASVFLQGAPAQQVYFLESGHVRLLRHLEDGQLITLHTAGPGEFFAEGALFTERYHCNAVTHGACGLRVLSKAVLLQRMAADASLSLLFLERVTRQLHRARTLAELRNIRSAQERTLQHLRLSLPAGASALTFAHPLLHVASELGLAHEVYYRCLANLAKAGVIEREGRTIRFL